MIGMDSYLDAYVDRRMKDIIGEWDLSTAGDLEDFEKRIGALEKEIPHLREFEQSAAEKLTELETRARVLKGRA